VSDVVKLNGSRSGVDSDVVIGGSVAAAVVALAMAVVIFICVRRQWSRSEERKLRLRAQLSGLAYGNDEEVNFYHTAVE